MKPSLLLVLFTVFALSFIACGDDDEGEKTLDVPKEYDTLSGQIEGEVFEYGSATFDIYEDRISFDIFKKVDGITDSCYWNGNEDEIFFNSPNTLELQELSFEFGDTDNAFTITLFDEETFLNVIVSEGCFKIDEVTEDYVKGRMDIHSGNDNFMKGGFIAYDCN